MALQRYCLTCKAPITRDNAIYCDKHAQNEPTVMETNQHVIRKAEEELGRFYFDNGYFPLTINVSNFHYKIVVTRQGIAYFCPKCRQLRETRMRRPPSNCSNCGYALYDRLGMKVEILPIHGSISLLKIL